MAKPTHRNHRNNPYLIDEYLVRWHRTAAGVLWRFRTEITTVLTVAGGAFALSRAITVAGTIATLIPLLVFVLIAPATRRFLIRRAWCVLTRHRIQRVCF